MSYVCYLMCGRSLDRTPSKEPKSCSTLRIQFNTQVMRAAGKGVALDPTDPNVGIVTLDAGGEAWLEFETALFKGQMRIRVRGGQKKARYLTPCGS